MPALSPDNRNKTHTRTTSEMVHMRRQTTAHCKLHSFSLLCLCQAREHTTSVCGLRNLFKYYTRFLPIVLHHRHALLHRHIHEHIDFVPHAYFVLCKFCLCY